MSVVINTKETEEVIHDTRTNGSNFTSTLYENNQAEKTNMQESQNDHYMTVL